MELYKKSGLSTISDLTTEPTVTLQFLKDALVLLNWHKNYEMNFEMMLIKENGESLTVPEFIHNIYKQLNRKFKYLRWGAYSITCLFYLPEILSLYPNAQFIQINEDRTRADSTVILEFEQPLEERTFTDLEYAKIFFKAKKYISNRQILSIYSESLIEKPAESIKKFIQFFKIDDPGRQLHRFIMNNIQKELISVAPTTSQQI